MTGGITLVLCDTKKSNKPEEPYKMETQEEQVKKPNTFAELEKKSSEAPVNSEENKPQHNSEPVKSKGEISLDDFSDTAVGDKVKYTRPDLNGSVDVVNKFQVFMPDIAKDELKSAQSGTAQYWSVSMILTYESKNQDGVNNREYISGAICFKNRDGDASEPSFWYDGCEHQSGMLWEKVAAALGIEPEKMSPRQFVAFLNSKPQVKIAGMQYKNYNAPAGSPKHVTKNMPGEFIKG